jgi:Uma2 family endonuclease
MAAQLLPAIPETVARKRFTRDEFHRMEECGILEGRYELIEGDLIEKTGRNPPHASALRLMCAWLAACFGMERLSVQLPIEVAPGDRERSRPEPDIAVLNALLPDYSQRHPRGDELTLAVEIADSSSRFDLATKAALYARAGVPEYWVLDLTRRVLVIHRHPENGTYRRVEQLAEQETAAINGKTLLISAVLG